MAGRDRVRLGEADFERIATVRDPDLAAAAHNRLVRAGFGRVRTITGDATSGVAEAAPFDRIISTACVHLGRVPYAWIDPR